MRADYIAPSSMQRLQLGCCNNNGLYCPNSAVLFLAIKMNSIPTWRRGPLKPTWGWLERGSSLLTWRFITVFTKVTEGNPKPAKYSSPLHIHTISPKLCISNTILPSPKWHLPSFSFLACISDLPHTWSHLMYVLPGSHCPDSISRRAQIWMRLSNACTTI
jgi:hypothetical protein